MDGLFFVAMSEIDRQMRHSLNGATPHGSPDSFATPGLLARLRGRLPRAEESRPAGPVTSNEPGQPGLGHTAPSTSR